MRRNIQTYLKYKIRKMSNLVSLVEQKNRYIKHLEPGKGEAGHGKTEKEEN